MFFQTVSPLFEAGEVLLGLSLTMFVAALIPAPGPTRSFSPSITLRISRASRSTTTGTPSPA